MKGAPLRIFNRPDNRLNELEDELMDQQQRVVQLELEQWDLMEKANQLSIENETLREALENIASADDTSTLEGAVAIARMALKGY